MKTIEVKNENCDDLDYGIVPCEKLEVFVIYLKNKSWRVYGAFELKSQKDYDRFIEEVCSEAKIKESDIKLVQPTSVNFVEVSLKKLQSKKLQAEKAAAKKKIQKLKEKFAI